MSGNRVDVLVRETSIELATDLGTRMVVLVFKTPVIEKLTPDSRLTEIGMRPDAAERLANELMRCVSQIRMHQ